MNSESLPILEVGQDWQPYPNPASPLLFDARGVRRTASLFVEVSTDSNRDPIFTMRDYPHKGMISAYNIFMNSVDEGDAAMKLVGCMGHWRKLLRCDWFMNGNVEFSFEGLNQWRMDLLTRDMTRAKGIYEDRMRQGDLSAAKAMMALIEKMSKIYKDMGEQAVKAKSTRRGTQTPVAEEPSSVVDLSSEIARLKGNK